MRNEKLRERIARLDALEERLQAGLSAWGELCTEVKSWSERGLALEAKANAAAAVINRGLQEWANTRRTLLEDIDDPADFWKT